MTSKLVPLEAVKEEIRKQLHDILLDLEIGDENSVIEQIIALMKSQQQEEINKIVVGMKSSQEKDKKYCSIHDEDDDRFVCHQCACEESNKHWQKEIAFMKSEQEKELLGMKGGKSIFSLGFVSGQQQVSQAHSEKIDKVVDEWANNFHIAMYKSGQQEFEHYVKELKQKLREAVK